MKFYYILLIFLGAEAAAGPPGPVGPVGPVGPTPPGPEIKGCPNCKLLEGDYYCIEDRYYPHCVPKTCPKPFPPMDCAMLPCYRCDDKCIMINNYNCTGLGCPQHPECVPATCQEKSCHCGNKDKPPYPGWFKCVYERPVPPPKPPCPSCPAWKCIQVYFPAPPPKTATKLVPAPKG